MNKKEGKSSSRNSRKHPNAHVHLLPEGGNSVSAIVYVMQLAPVVGTAAAAVAFLATSRKTVRFNSLQALVLSLIYLVLAAMLSASRTGNLFSMVLSVIAFLSWLVLSFTALRGSKVMLPLLGELSEKYSR